MNKMYKENGELKESIPEIFAILRNSSDFMQYESKTKDHSIWIAYFRTLVDMQILHQSILPQVKGNEWKTLEKLKSLVPIENIIITIDTDVIKEKLLEGYVLINLAEYCSNVALFRATLNKARLVSLPEVEFSVVGPKEAFVESIESNLQNS